MGGSAGWSTYSKKKGAGWRSGEAALGFPFRGRSHGEFKQLEQHGRSPMGLKGRGKIIPYPLPAGPPRLLASGPLQVRQQGGKVDCVE